MHSSPKRGRNLQLPSDLLHFPNRRSFTIPCATLWIKFPSRPPNCLRHRNLCVHRLPDSAYLFAGPSRRRALAAPTPSAASHPLLSPRLRSPSSSSFLSRRHRHPNPQRLRTLVALPRPLPLLLPCVAPRTFGPPSSPSMTCATPCTGTTRLGPGPTRTRPGAPTAAGLYGNCRKVLGRGPSLGPR